MLQHSFRIVGALWIFIIAMTGCELASSKDPIIVPDVEDELYVDMWEQLNSPTGRSLVVKIESIEEKNCLNYRLDYFFSRNGNRLKVSLNNIIEPNDCVPGNAPVKAEVSAGSLPSGNYGFDIDFKGLVVNNGTLSVTSESYVLDMKSEHGIVLLRDELLRVPDDVIWGYAAYQQSADEAIAVDFINEVKAISKLAIGNRAGYYGHFTISPLDGKVFVHEQPSSNVKTFFYQYTDNETTLKNLVADYRQTYGNQLTIKVFNAKGKEF